LLFSWPSLSVSGGRTRARVGQVKEDLEPKIGVSLWREVRNPAHHDERFWLA
jgi:hypothetical protein